MLGHTVWSVRVADRDALRLKATEDQWEKSLGQAQAPGLGTAPGPGPGLGRISRAKAEGAAPVGGGKGKGKKDKETPKRTWGVLPSALCDHLPAHSLVSAHVQVIDTHPTNTPYQHTLSIHSVYPLTASCLLMYR